MATEVLSLSQAAGAAGQAKQPILKVEGLSKRYGEVAALRRVSFELREGEFVTLLGPSGSGKTTLLKIISGAITPSTGTVHLSGRDITTTESRFRGIGMVFQNFALMPHLSVFDNIAFPLSIRRVPRSEIRERVQEALKIVQLPDVGGRRPKELSGGQQQRVAIARALVYRPPLILMDEPLGALDRKLRQEMQLEIKKIHDNLGLSIIYVTHDQEEALTMSDRICLMGDGLIQEFGPPEQMYTRPESMFTADFFGATNIFEGVAAGPAGVEDETLGLVKAQPSAFAKGQKLGWMVRPERIRILREGEQEDNAVAGVIETVILTGQVTHVLAKAGPRTFSIACLTDDSLHALAEGMPIRFGWERAATKLLRTAPVS